MAYSTPTPKMKGRAMKFRKVIFSCSQPAMPTIHNTPVSSAPITNSAAFSGRTRSSTSSSTAENEVMVASRPSVRIDRIMAAKITALPEVCTSRPSASGTRCNTAAVRSRSRPS